MTDPSRDDAGRYSPADSEPTAKQVAKAEVTLSELPSKPWYTSRTIWLGVFDKIVNVVTILTAGILAFSQNDFVQDNPQLVLWVGIIVGLLNVIKSFAADMLRWIGGLPLSKIVAWLLTASLIFAQSAVYAGETAVVIDDSKPATYLVTVGADGSVAVNPIRVVRVGDQPNPDPIPGDPTPLEAAIKARALESLSKLGATKQTAAGLSAAYSLVASGIRDGSIPPTSSQSAIAIATGDRGVMKNATAADKAAWLPFKEEIIRKISEGFIAGDFPTKEALASFIDQVHNGIDYATGVTINTAQLQRLDPRTLGILDGIDLAKIIELIKLLLELFKLFRPM